MADVFISYTRDERQRCVGIADRLRALGLDVWFDAKLESGTSFDREIDEKVRAAKAVLVLWSPKSVQSNWVRSEATIGQQRNVLVSVEIAPCTLPVAFVNTHTEKLHRANFADDDPAWLNVLSRLAGLTAHPVIAGYRNREAEPVPARRGFKSLLAGLGGLALVSIAGGVGWTAWTNRESVAPEPPPVSSKQVGLDPSLEAFAKTLEGQWAFRAADCPARVPGQAVDMTPSTGAWFTVQPDGATLRTTSAGRTAIESIVGLQNGWLRTFAEGADVFYKVDESGRLLLRVGAGEAARMEPCI